MSENYSEPTYSMNINLKKKKNKHNYILHSGLFLVTFVTTLIAGIAWTTGSLGPYTVDDLIAGLPYAISVLFILSAHEFGHFFAAVYHKIHASLPYYIPFPPLPGFFNFGTMGAVIRTRERINDNKAMFDIGIAGPIAGFIACLIVLIYGFSNLPPIEYLLNIHPDFLSPEYGTNSIGLEFGDTLLFALLREIFTKPGDFVPPMSEVYHYPYLCVGWFGLFVTAMNMVPVGQLDGGHVVFSMFGGKIHEAVASVSLIILGVLGILGLLDSFLGLNLGVGWTGWLVWSVILLLIIKVKHPPVTLFQPLDKGRMILGYISLIILLLSFSPSPFIVSLS
ncbi:MAG: site-2 protease family protein [Ignavibacteria bacterium]